MKKGQLVSNYADSYIGFQNGDTPRWVMRFWEVPPSDQIWSLFQSTPNHTVPYTGRHSVLCWEQGMGGVAQDPQALIKGTAAWGRKGVIVRLMRYLPCSLYSGDFYDQSSAVIIPQNPSHLPAIWCFCKSPEFNRAVRQIDQKLNVTNATLVKVPFDLEYWQKLAEEEYPNGLPEPYSDDPTQWIFHGHPCGSVVWDKQTKWTMLGQKRTDATVLQVAVARLLGYRWPAELDPDMRLCAEQRFWTEKSRELNSFSDADGIVCLPAVMGERPAVNRLRDLLAAAYGTDWSVSMEDALLNQVGYKGKGLDVWLRDAFFDQHAKLFHNRPFIWHIWDGRKDGFSALLNYHKLNRAKLEKLIYSYLGDWIHRQKEAVAADIPGAETRLAAAQELQKRLKAILVGEAPYDIYVRWKPLHEQPIGWEPDLNDGVRLNIRPFVHAGVLRSKVTINWNKDRGRNPDGSERINDFHLTLEEKRRAREKAKEA